MSHNNRNKNQNISKSKLCSFGYVDFIVAASTIAIALAEEFSPSDLNILASFLATLSDELALISSVQACPNNSIDNDDAFTPPPAHISLSRDSFNGDIKKSKKRTIIKKIKRKKITKHKNI